LPTRRSFPVECANCDRALDGKVIATIERLGVPIGVVKDRRAVTRPDVAHKQ
jgi:hypothetical protein